MTEIVTVPRRLLPETTSLADAGRLEDYYVYDSVRDVRLNFVTALDGAIEIDGRSGPLGGPADRAAFKAMRAQADVILVGGGTARAERYGPVTLDASARARRAGRGQEPVPTLAVVTARGNLEGLRLPARPDGESAGPVLVLTTDGQAAAITDDRVEAVGCGPDHVDLSVAMSHLRARGLDRVLCEGGPALVRDLLDLGLVDELCLTISPVLAGPGHRILTGDAGLDPPVRLTLTGVAEGDGLLLCRYRVRR